MDGNAILDYVPEANPYSSFVNGQKFALVPSFKFECGIILTDATVAYKTWGRLNATGDNCLVVCHALSGSSDISDWWGPLLGPGEAFDTSRYLVFCANVLGSPYGTTSCLSVNPETGRIYGPDFPETTIRDDVQLHKLVLDALGVTKVAAVVGGSMGGMATLEWPLCTPQGYINAIVPISTSVDHDAWGISWAEAQRQCVFADPVFDDGYYDPTPAGQPASGLAAARMVAMLTYRSSPSFSARFGRGPATDRGSKTLSPKKVEASRVENGLARRKEENPKFTAQSYLQYQGQKFVNRFDANCFIHLTRKMDHHDISRGRIPQHSSASVKTSREVDLKTVLSRAPPKSLVVGIASDVLFTPEQQEVLVNSLPEAELVMIPSREGHDGFLLEFEVLSPLITDFLRERCPEIYDGEPLNRESDQGDVVKNSVFGEVEAG
ncbi:homoserine O-acetyltransferase [Amylocarpus encephaloides]|uniref:Homoserine O-acetyltransferase n=1 Tax=Amylocarpus encephaloides TaxID=45428 RepID=A0A9P8C7I1_9HELO|nr:homoserine O-acetyltransferase [Amylocarpus encephaloides]